MKETLYIIKIGGNVIEDEDKMYAFLDSFCELRKKKILVHGGGKTATQIAEQMGYQAVMIDGRRVTDSNMLKVVTMTYGGLVNKKIVCQLQARGVNSMGLTGSDGNLIQSEKRPKKGDLDFGWVGDPISVNTTILMKLLESGIMPVIAPLTHDGKGNILNTNADTIASVIASSIIEYFDVQLIYAFELDGVLKEVENHNSLIPRLDHGTYQKMKNEGTISKGMIPKIDNAFSALKEGISSVRLMNYKKVGELDKEKNYDHTIITI